MKKVIKNYEKSKSDRKEKGVKRIENKEDNIEKENTNNNYEDKENEEDKDNKKKENTETTSAQETHNIEDIKSIDNIMEEIENKKDNAIFNDLENIILAALYTSLEPLSLAELYRAINNKYTLEKGQKKISKQGIEKIIEKIKDKLIIYALPFRITKKENGNYDLIIEENYFKYVEDFAPIKEFSRATLQTLAFIAYKSPIKQSVVVEVRGNRAYEQIKELMEAGFIIKEKAGHTSILKISKKFLKYFGLKNEEELRNFFKSKYIEEEDFNK